MKARYLVPFFTAVTAISLTMGLGVKAQATPAFARMTKLPCTSCHYGGTNRLTRFGRDFMTRGFRSVDEEGPKEPGDINISQYVAIIGQESVTADQHADPSTTFYNEYHILAGGPLNENFGFFLDTLLGDSAGDSAQVAAGYLNYSTSGTGDDFLFVRAGKISPLILKSFGVDPPIGSSTLSSLTGSGLANPNDTTPNPFVATDAQTGIAVGYRTAKRLVAEAAVTTGPEGDPPSTNSKGVFASVEQELDENGSALGVYGFNGKYPGLVDVNGNTYADNFSRLAVFGAYDTENLMGTASYVLGSDSVYGAPNRHPNAYSLELAYNTKHDVTPYIRYENDNADTVAGKQSAVTLGVSIRLRQLGRIVFEGMLSKNPDGSTDQSAGAELDWAF